MKELVSKRKKLKLDRMQLSKWMGVNYMALRRYELNELPIPIKIIEKYKKTLNEYEIFINKIKNL